MRSKNIVARRPEWEKEQAQANIPEIGGHVERTGRWAVKENRKSYKISIKENEADQTGPWNEGWMVRLLGREMEMEIVEEDAGLRRASRTKDANT